MDRFSIQNRSEIDAKGILEGPCGFVAQTIGKSAVLRRNSAATPIPSAEKTVYLRIHLIRFSLLVDFLVRRLIIIYLLLGSLFF